MKKSVLAILLCGAAFASSAQQFDTQNQKLGIASRTVSPDNTVEAVQDELTNIGLSTANSQLSAFSSSLLGENLKYLSLSLGQDEGKLQLEGMSVYGLQETKNWFVFNQTSIVNYDGRTTLNFGLGARHINDSDTVILGLNAFHDLEFDSNHRRASIGGEVITSLLQLRVNYYKGLTGERLYEGVYEEALDGQDIKLTYELPYFYGSDIYFLSSRWYDGQGYGTSSKEVGVSAELSPNLMFKLAGNRTDGGSTDASASVTYRIVLGAKPDNRVKRDGVWKFALEPVRDMLYQPVERENRVMKTKKTLGVIAVGF